MKAYCKDEGLTEVPKLMVGYIIWITGKWCKWESENGRPIWSHKSEEDHDEFDVWLVKDVGLI